MDGPIEFFLDSGTYLWPSLTKSYNFYPYIFAKNKAPEVKRGLKTLHACTLGHLDQRVDESPKYEDHLVFLGLRYIFLSTRNRDFQLLIAFLRSSIA